MKLLILSYLAQHAIAETCSKTDLWVSGSIHNSGRYVRYSKAGANGDYPYYLSTESNYFTETGIKSRADIIYNYPFGGSSTHNYWAWRHSIGSHWRVITLNYINTDNYIKTGEDPSVYLKFWCPSPSSLGFDVLWGLNKQNQPSCVDRNNNEVKFTPTSPQIKVEMICPLENECPIKVDCHEFATCTHMKDELTYKCTCNQGYEGDGKTCAVNPCPSERCWHYDAPKNTCTMKSDCAALTCSENKMTMFLKQEVFNSNNDFKGLQPKNPTSNQPDPSVYQYKVECPFGDCEMKTTMSEGKLKLTVELTQSGEERTRTDNNIIKINEHVLETAPHGIMVRFVCSYKDTVSLSSDKFDIDDISILGETAADGDLTQGFKMSLSHAAATGKWILGGMQGVTVEWAVKSFMGVSFFLETCAVNDETKSQEFAVVKNNCFSKTLQAVRKPDVNGATQTRSFTYRTFRIRGSTGKSLQFKCDVKICKDAGCSKPKTCPTAGTDAAFTYTIDG